MTRDYVLKMYEGLKNLIDRRLIVDAFVTDAYSKDGKAVVHTNVIFTKVAIPFTLNEEHKFEDIMQIPLTSAMLDSDIFGGTYYDSGNPDLPFMLANHFLSLAEKVLYKTGT